MKNSISILLTTFLILFTSYTFAQKFEGKISFSITYKDLPQEMAALESMLPKEMAIKLKKNSSRVEQNTALGSTINIYNSDAKENYMLMDMAEKKVAIKLTIDEVEEEKKSIPTPKIKYLKETKKIAGYTCKKAEITMTDSSEPIIVYYTNKIQSEEETAQFKGLKGYPMQYEIHLQGIKSVITATEVSKEKISDNEFTIPEEYTEMTMLEFQQEMQKQLMGGQ